MRDKTINSKLNEVINKINWSLNLALKPEKYIPNLKKDTSEMPSTPAIQSKGASLLPNNAAGEPPVTCVLQHIPPFGQYYVYCSNTKLGGAEDERPKYKNGIARPKGAHDYHSLMWDPHIYRGPTYKTFKRAEEDRCKKSAKDALTERRKKGRKGTQIKFGGIVRPKTPPLHSDKIGLEDMGIQTEAFLEEITDEVQEKEMSTQTDQMYDMELPRIFLPTKQGLDASTQIMPWELFKFDSEAKPIVSSVVGKIIEQSLFETMEEEELESLLAQQRQHEERHRMELLRLRRLQEREQKVTEERTRLIEQQVKEAEEEKDTETRIGASLFSADYLSSLASNALEDLKKEGFLVPSKSLEDIFIPWLHEAAVKQAGRRNVACELLDDIIQKVVQEREAEVADNMWREISSRQGMYPDEYEGEGEEYFGGPYSDGYDGGE